MLKLGVFVVAGFFAAQALAVDLNIKVTDPNGNSSITVTPGATVNYRVEGVLTSSADNMGIALVAGDLTFDGGDLAQADAPTTTPMNNFVRNLGIDNPAGYGGTIIDGDIVQWGGGQNTINNTPGNAAFPIGTVITGVGHSNQVFLTGSLTAPTQNGTYTLALENVFANVIKPGQTGNPFWATEVAGIGTVDNLTITVGGTGGCNGNEQLKNPKCKTKSGSVKTLKVSGTGGTPGQSYCAKLGTGQEVCKAAKSNGSFKITFKGGDAPPCGANTVTVCGQTKSFDCVCN